MPPPSPMESPSSHPKARKLQRKYFPNILPNLTNTHPNTPPKTFTMTSASRASSTPSPRSNSSQSSISSTHHSESPIDNSKLPAKSTKTLPAPTTEQRGPPSQLSHSTGTHGADREPPFSPALSTRTGDSDSDTDAEGGDDEESTVDLPYEAEDEDDWQDAQIRESQLYRAEDEEAWIDPLEGILGPPVIEEWQLLEEEKAGNDEWSDDEDWHTSDIQNRWVGMKREVL